jgi:hypothetical protein
MPEAVGYDLLGSMRWAIFRLYQRFRGEPLCRQGPVQHRQMEAWK